MPAALVLGASGDIGEAVCRRLAKEGWSLYCHYHHNGEKVLKFVSELRESYPHQDFFMVCLDMLDYREIAPFLADLFHVDGVVFAAGFTKYGLLSEHSQQDMTALWKVHVETPMLLLASLEDKLRQSGRGRVVFIGSVYGLAGSSMETVYSAVKGAQQSFAKAYAKEVASLGITVNCVAPGAVATQMNHQFTDDQLQELSADIPLGRLAATSEIAAAVAYLFSKEAQYTTGTTIPVTGGWLY
ncbi:SDR family oxidoreductase [Enterococcus asini]|uniref:elongation factor P 5-aminopentanone reductase n=1 Tax=Enterococcus asini TaxID=57732 RepID=UPI000E48E158|nr:SDR family oxidoreductase [Enterococcus asini]RGW12292.1 SDR family NAD(P)-dependent oxidoreductase [Enterococcus asini]